MPGKGNKPSLTPKQIETIIKLRDRDGLTWAQIAERFGVTLQGVRNIYGRAKRNGEAQRPAG